MNIFLLRNYLLMLILSYMNIDIFFKDEYWLYYIYNYN